MTDDAKKTGHRESSDKLSSLAGKIMSKPDPFAEMKDWNAGTLARIHELFDPWVQAARSLAGSVLSQDETPGDRGEPNAGTSAYQMIADVEQANVETTETLIHMIAATVLMKGIRRFEHSEAMEVSFSPLDVDAMHRAYEMSAKRDGMITVVRITPRVEDLPLPPKEAHLEALPESLMTQDMPETAFEPQAEVAVYDRPVWAIRWLSKDETWHFAKMHDRNDAERQIERYKSTTMPTIENRWCLHSECPSEHCNVDRRTNTGQASAEVASDD